MRRHPSYAGRTVAALAGWVAAQAQAGPPPGAAPATAGREVFSVLEYRVLHNTVLPTRQVESAVYPHLGPGKTIDDVQAARAALEQAYHAAGYSSVFVDVPEQSIGEGIVRLSVTEGRVGSLRVSGERYVSGRAIRAAVPSLAPGTVPHFPDVQQQINDVNRESGDLAVVPVLKAGQTPGTVDVDLKVKDELPLHGSIEVNDHNTPDTTRTRVNFSLSYTNLFQTYQSLSLQYQLAPERHSDAGVFSGTYLIPFSAGGPSLALYTIKTNSDVAAVGTLSVVGRGEIYGARYIIPLTLGGNLYQTLTFGGEYKSFGQNVLLVDGGGIQTPIHYLNWTGIYNVSLATPRTRSSVEIATDFGVRGVANSIDEFENNRAMAQPNYYYVRLNASHERVLTHGWSMAVRLNSQFSAAPLINNEQFAIGGATSVRGYLESEALGDSGVAAGFELRSPSLPTLITHGAREAYGYLFTDGGLVALVDPLPSQTPRTRLWSLGGGMRLTAFAGLDAELSFADARLATPYTHAGDYRFLFDVRYGL